MNSFELKYTLQKLAADKVSKETVTKTINLPSAVEEITLLQWCRYHELREQHKELLATFEQAEANPSEADWFRFFAFAAKAVAIFSDNEAEAEEVLQSASASTSASNSLLAMYAGCVAPLLAYQPKQREYFVHGKYRYLVPEDVKQSFGAVLVGGKMSVAQAVDALQIEHALTAVDDQGKPLMPDQRYHKDIYITAALCRRIERDGSIEIPPIDFVERREWLDDRVEQFKDISMDKALDVVFFFERFKEAIKSHPLISIAFKNFARSPAARKAVQANKPKWQTWGWYSIYVAIAEGGMFNRTGKTPMESAAEANIYEALTWYAQQQHMSVDLSQ